MMRILAGTELLMVNSPHYLSIHPGECSQNGLLVHLEKTLSL